MVEYKDSGKLDVPEAVRGIGKMMKMRVFRVGPLVLAGLPIFFLPKKEFTLILLDRSDQFTMTPE